MTIPSQQNEQYYKAYKIENSKIQHSYAKNTVSCIYKNIYKQLMCNTLIRVTQNFFIEYGKSLLEHDCRSYFISTSKTDAFLKAMIRWSDPSVVTNYSNIMLKRST